MTDTTQTATDAAVISDDAITFGMCFLSHDKHKLSFGGDGAEMMITDRSRAALNELLSAGLAEVITGDDQIPNRENYCGKGDIRSIAKQAGYDPFIVENDWVTFSAEPTPPTTPEDV